MEELLKAIEVLKRAYKASGAKSVKVELVDGDTKCILIDKQKYALENIQKKPITNGEWLRGLSNQEFVDFMYGKSPKPIFDYMLAWLRAEHKE